MNLATTHLRNINVRRHTFNLVDGQSASNHERKLSEWIRSRHTLLNTLAAKDQCDRKSRPVISKHRLLLSTMFALRCYWHRPPDVVHHLRNRDVGPGGPTRVAG